MSDKGWVYTPCAWCGLSYWHQRRGHPGYCSDAHRKAAARARAEEMVSGPRPRYNSKGMFVMYVQAPKAAPPGRKPRQKQPAWKGLPKLDAEGRLYFAREDRR